MDLNEIAKLAYLDELIALQEGWEKIGAKDEPPVKARDIAIPAAAVGVGGGLAGGAAGAASALGKESLRSKIRDIEKQQKQLAAENKYVGKGLGTPGVGKRLERLETLQRSLEGTKKMLHGRLKGKGRIAVPLALAGGGLAGGAAAAGYMASKKPEVRAAAKKTIKAVKPYV